MRTEVIHEFVVLAETMNYTKTAARLNITQSTLSKHMVELEKETGLALFNHSVSAPSLTEVGNRFLQRFSIIDSQVAASLDECRCLQDSPALSLKIHNAALSVVCNPVRKSLRAFLKENPRSSIAFSDIPLADTVQDALMGREVDVAFDAVSAAIPSGDYVARMADMGFNAYEYAVEPMVVWLRNDHPLAARDSVGFDDVKGYPIITSSGYSYDSIQKVLIGMFEAEGVNPRFRKFYLDRMDDGFAYFSLTEFEDSLMFTTSGMTQGGLLASRPDITFKFSDDQRMKIRIFILVRQADEFACRFLEFCKTLA